MKIVQFFKLMTMISLTVGSLFTKLEHARVDGLTDHYACGHNAVLNMTICEIIKEMIISYRTEKCSEENILVTIELGKDKESGELYMKPYTSENRFVTDQSYSDCKIIRKYYINNEKVLVRTDGKIDLLAIADADFYVFKELISNLRFFTAFAYFFGWYSDEKNIFYKMKPVQVFIDFS